MRVISEPGTHPGGGASFKYKESAKHGNCSVFNKFKSKGEFCKNV